jgi:hypothetical protein
MMLMTPLGLGLGLDLDLDLDLDLIAPVGEASSFPSL